MLSHEQYQKLVELKELALPTVVMAIKETKIGQGLKFLPRRCIVSTCTGHRKIDSAKRIDSLLAFSRTIS